MGTKRDSTWKSLDWVTIGIYIVLLAFGWLSVCGASYDFGDHAFWDLSTRSGKQLLWICCSFGIAFVLLMLEESLYDILAFIIYIVVVALLVVTIFIAPDTKGSHSWLVLGPVSLQPAEFAKFATALALAKYMSMYSFSIKNWRTTCVVLGLIFLPMLLIVMQHETGSALVFTAFFLMLYREGMSGAVLYAGLCAVVFFVVGIRFGDQMLGATPTSVGIFAVLLLILLSAAGMARVYSRRWIAARTILIALGSVLPAGVCCALWLFPLDLNWLLYALCALCVGYLLFLALRERMVSYAMIALFVVLSIGFLLSSNYFFHHILGAHQRTRIEVVLGMTEDLTGAGYNVNQSKIAIGSGGFLGKGFLNGTQTKLKYVPEQDTDFIFCTIGEEQGFVGASVVMMLFLALLLRLIHISERQPTLFGRVYGYSVLSIFFFHLFVNVGMALGLTPVIGIPLPFFSYGGSSLWGFTILLFILLRIDAERKRRFDWF
ncbi:MAG: rod shape-determining protein RodA [Prevotellaceae bacterium]|jgi:rod shape determining protein RodA|nr:rod shape-determining protein RodA [Prevotellaceae bacterium]